MVICPLVALIQDQIAQFKIANIDCGALGSTTDDFERIRTAPSPSHFGWWGSLVKAVVEAAVVVDAWDGLL